MFGILKNSGVINDAATLLPSPIFCMTPSTTFFGTELDIAGPSQCLSQTRAVVTCGHTPRGTLCNFIMLRSSSLAAGGSKPPNLATEKTSAILRRVGRRLAKVGSSGKLGGPYLQTNPHGTSHLEAKKASNSIAERAGESMSPQLITRL